MDRSCTWTFYIYYSVKQSNIIIISQHFNITGYFEKEIKKEGIKVQNLDINPEAPAPRDMVDLEVRDICLIWQSQLQVYSYLGPWQNFVSPWLCHIDSR